MAINYLNSLDLNKNEILQGVIENQPNDAAAGASPVEGQLYFNTTNHVLMQYNGTSWEEAGGGVETLTTADGTYIDLTPNAPTDGAVTVTADLSAVDGTAVAATRFLSKDNTWDVPAFPASDNYDYWVLDADGAGATAQIGSGDTADFVGGRKITTNSTAGGTLNIVHDLQTQTDSTSVASPAAGATFTVVDSVTRDTTGHATGLNVKTITLPADTNTTLLGIANINGAEQFTVNDTASGRLRFAATGGASVAFDSTNKVVTYAAPSNTNETYTLPVAAGTVNTAVLNLTAGGSGSGIKSVVTIAGTTDQVAISFPAAGVVQVGLPDDVIITDNLSLAGEISQTGAGLENTFASELNMSSQKITNVLDPTSAQDAATKQYVDTAVIGLLQFVGGFDASTGVIANTNPAEYLTDDAARVAVEVGDYYVVTVDGDFFGNAATPLTVGDSVIVQTAAAAGASVEGDFIVVQSDTDLATLTTVGIGNVGNAGVGTTTTYSNGTATITNTDKGSSQNIFKNVASSSGTAVADSNNDTLTIVGAGGISTAVSGDTLTITSSNTNSANTYATTITDSVSGTTLNHGLGEDVIVQLYDATNKDTVYADVVRNGNYLNISFSSTPTNSIRVLVQKIG